MATKTCVRCKEVHNLEICPECGCKHGDFDENFYDADDYYYEEDSELDDLVDLFERE